MASIQEIDAKVKEAAKELGAYLERSNHDISSDEGRLIWVAHTTLDEVSFLIEKLIESKDIREKLEERLEDEGITIPLHN